MSKYGGLTVICNGCGKPMRDIGEWPVHYPSPQLANRYTCDSCRQMATILETGDG